MRLAIGLCLALVLGLVPGAATPAETRVAQASVDTVLRTVLRLVNAARAEGRHCGPTYYPATLPLSEAPALQRAAHRHARDMARHGYFDHRAPDGTAPKDRVRAAGYRPRLTGENIAFAPESAEEVVQGWLDSPGHCANIMDARFTQTGLGLALGARRGHIYWVQTFGAPLSAAERAR